jgi:O-antigen ligase
MSTDRPARTIVASHRLPGPISQLLGAALVALLGLLLVEVLLESWIQVRFGTRVVHSSGSVTVDSLGWPKTVKSGLYLALAALSAAKIAADRRWRDLRTGADAALVVLGVILVAAGLVNGSSPQLIGEALFVYFRGAIVFYAIRALRPGSRQVRGVALIVGALVALDIAVALAQMLFGIKLYSGLGWVNLEWARTHRAQGLFDHPNHLGHVLALAILGLLAWMLTRSRISWRWWATLGVLALALSASQSRESVLGALAGAVVIWLLARTGGRRVAIVLALIVAAAAGQVALRPENLAEWQRRIAGAVNAFRVPSGSEPTATPPSVPTAPASTASPSAPPTVQPSVVAPTPVPTAAREIRVLYYQQGVRLWLSRPILGYGVGQFGGIVAEQNNPNWHLNPKFGPNGFDRHGFESVTVDSFWLHLLVEAGLLGIAAYLVWLVLLVLPLLRISRRGEAPARARWLALWGTAAVVLVALVAFLAPSFEDPVLPPLLFSILGLAWVALPRPAGRVALPEQLGEPAVSQRLTPGLAPRTVLETGVRKGHFPDELATDGTR